MNRAGEDRDVRHYRADRFFAVSSEWYFSTRENQDQGPYRSRQDAEQALVSYVRAHKYVGLAAVAASKLVGNLEQGFAALMGLHVEDAWTLLAAAGREMQVVVESTETDLFTCCDRVLRTAETLYKEGDTRLAGLPAHLRDYSHRNCILPFPLAGMLVPERLYLKKPSAKDTFCCKLSEAGTVTISDDAGSRMEESLAGVPLDARAAVLMLISMMQGIIPQSPFTH